MGWVKMGAIATVRKEMRWPRCKYTGRRISGIELGFRIDVFAWRLSPRINALESAIEWLCFRFVVKLAKDYSDLGLGVRYTKDPLGHQLWPEKYNNK